MSQIMYNKWIIEILQANHLFYKSFYLNGRLKGYWILAVENSFENRLTIYLQFHFGYNGYNSLVYDLSIWFDKK